MDEKGARAGEPQQPFRRRAATASQAEAKEFRARAASAGQQARAHVSSMVARLRHMSNSSLEEKKKKIKYYVSILSRF